MKWFSHTSDARQDPKLKLVKNKFGVEGYGVYFQLVEIVAHNIKPDNPEEWGTIESVFDTGLLAVEVGVSTRRLTEMLKFFDKLGLTTKESGKLCIPTIRKNIDEYTRKATIKTKRPPKKKSLKQAMLRGDKPKKPEVVKTVSGHNPDNVRRVSGIQDNIIHNKTIQKDINTGNAGKPAAFKEKLGEAKKLLADGMGFKPGVSTQWQDRALMYAEKLGIDFDKTTPGESFKSRWFAAFKRSSPGKLAAAFSYVTDHPNKATFNSDKKIKLFFWRLANGNA